MHTHTQEVRCSVTLARPAGSLAAFPQACLLSPGIKTYIHLQEPNSNPNPNPDMSSLPPLKHLGHCTWIKHPFHKGDEARSAGREPAFQGEQKPKKESHLGKPLYCRWVAQLCLDPLWPLDCSTPGFPVLYSLPELAQILLRSHHPRTNNFLSERNDPELVTMTKVGRSTRRRNADSLLKIVISFSYPPVKELSAFLPPKTQDCQINWVNWSPLSGTPVSWIMEPCLKSKDCFLFRTCKVKNHYT